MKKSRRDQILTTAFGDADSLDLQGLTDEERAEFEDAKMLSEGLKTLREVPECQLSTERLVGAVLSSAVKRKQSYAWGYAAAAFVAIAFFALQSSLFSPRDSSETNVAVGTDAAEDKNDLVAVLPDRERNDAPLDVEAILSETPGSEDLGPPAPMVTDEDADPPVVDGLGVPEDSNDAVDTKVDHAAIVTADPVGMITVSLPSSVPAVREPLVIVDFALEDVNGTYVATEVETFGDVVFGG